MANRRAELNVEIKKREISFAGMGVYGQQKFKKKYVFLGATFSFLFYGDRVTFFLWFLFGFLLSDP